MNQAVIDIQGITKTYVNGKLSVPVLHGIDLQVNKGEFVSIMGPSGSGKSTFMNILGCLDRPTTGSYRLNGDEVATLSDDELAFVRNKQIGFVFQSFNLLTKLTALENVALPMIYAGMDKKSRNERAAALLSSVGLGDRMDHLPSELSGGQRQRVAIARAILKDPRILILDEATSALDTESERAIQSALEELKKDRTVLVIAHRLSTIENADEILVIEHGEIKERGTHQDLLALDGAYKQLHSMQFSG